jgi:hypothetical protein
MHTPLKKSFVFLYKFLFTLLQVLGKQKRSSLEFILNDDNIFTTHKPLENLEKKETFKTFWIRNFDAMLKFKDKGKMNENPYFLTWFMFKFHKCLKPNLICQKVQKFSILKSKEWDSFSQGINYLHKVKELS